MLAPCSGVAAPEHILPNSVVFALCGLSAFALLPGFSVTFRARAPLVRLKHSPAVRLIAGNSFFEITLRVAGQFIFDLKSQGSAFLQN